MPASVVGRSPWRHLIVEGGIISIRTKFSLDAVVGHHLGISDVEVGLALMVVGAGLGLGPLDGVGVLVVGLGHIIGVELFGVILPPQKLFITITDSLASLRKTRSTEGDQRCEPVS